MKRMSENGPVEEKHTGPKPSEFIEFSFEERSESVISETYSVVSSVGKFRHFPIPISPCSFFQTLKDPQEKACPLIVSALMSLT